MSLAARVAAAIAALSIVTAVLVTGTAIVSNAALVRADLDEFLEERAEEIIDGTRNQPDRGGRGNDDDDIDDDALVLDDPARAATDFDAQVQIIDEDGVVTARTNVALPVTDTALELADDGGRGVYETVTIDGIEYRLYVDDIPGGGAVQVARSLEDATLLTGELRTRLLLQGVGLALLAAAIGWFISRRALRPLGDLTAAAERVAVTKELDSAIEVDNPNDEIGRLATSFNEMLDALEASQEQQHQLVQNAAHELRTPLTSVSANIDLLMHAKDLPADDRQEILTGVRAELGQLNTLFTEIIELATDRRETITHEVVDLASVANRAVDDLSRRSTNPVTVDAEASEVMGDFNSLHRAVTNLLGNAVKYSPDDSPIHVTVTGGTISVRDHGPGIPVEDRELIFERFHRLDHSRPAPGSGLGLAIVNKIVADHGGTSFVTDADPGPGAVVGFTIPTI